MALRPVVRHLPLAVQARAPPAGEEVKFHFVPKYWGSLWSHAFFYVCFEARRTKPLTVVNSAEVKHDDVD